MKKLILMMMMAMGFISSQAAPKVTLNLTFELARPKNYCLYGLWVCHLKADGGVDHTGREVSISATDNQNGTMLIVFNSKLPENGSEFYGDQDETVKFPYEIASKFGYSSLEIVPGNYRISPPTKGNFGSVLVSIKTK